MIGKIMKHRTHKTKRETENHTQCITPFKDTNGEFLTAPGRYRGNREARAESAYHAVNQAWRRA